MSSSKKITIGQIEQIKIENILNLAAALAQKLEASDIAGLASESWVNNQNLAPKTYVQQKIADLVASSPAALDTLIELAAALGNDPNFSTTVLNQIAGKKDDFSVLPVAEGGTGKTSIGAEKLLIGNAQGGYSEISKAQLKSDLATTFNDATGNGDFSDRPVKVKNRVYVKSTNSTNLGNFYGYIDNEVEDILKLVLFGNGKPISVLKLQKDYYNEGNQTGNAGAHFSTRVSGSLAKQDYDFVTLSQLNSVSDTIKNSIVVAYKKTNLSGLNVPFVLDADAVETIYMLSDESAGCPTASFYDGLLPSPVGNKNKILTLVSVPNGSIDCPFGFTNSAPILDRGSFPTGMVRYMKLISDDVNWLRIG